MVPSVLYCNFCTVWYPLFSMVSSVPVCCISAWLRTAKHWSNRSARQFYTRRGRLTRKSIYPDPNMRKPRNAGLEFPLDYILAQDFHHMMKFPANMTKIVANVACNWNSGFQHSRVSASLPNMKFNHFARISHIRIPPSLTI